MMIRLLDFTGDRAAKRFELLRAALISGGDGKGDRTRDVIRKEARLLDALDTISEPGPVAGSNGASAPPGEPSRVLLASADTLELDQDAFDLLSKYVDVCPWAPRVAREVVDVQDWLSAAEKRDEKPRAVGHTSSW